MRLKLGKNQETFKIHRQAELQVVACKTVFACKLLIKLASMDVGIGGKGGTCLHFSKSRANCPFSCNLAALLKDSEDAKIASRMHVSIDFRRSRFRNFLGEHASGPLS